MGFFNDMFHDFDKLAKPWTIKKSDIENAKLGSPIHGLKAGLSVFKATDPIRQTIHTFRNIRDHGLVNGLKVDMHEKGHQNEDMVKENKVPLMIVATMGLGSAMSAGSAAGDAGSAAGAAADAGEAATAVDAGATAAETAGAAGTAAEAAGTTAGVAGETGLGIAADGIPTITVTGTQTGGALAGWMQGAGIAGNIGANMVNSGSSVPTSDVPTDQVANSPNAQNIQTGTPTVNAQSSAPSQGILSKGMDFVKSPGGQAVIGLAGNVMKGVGDSQSQQANIDAQNYRYTYNANQWRDPNQLAALKASVVPQIGVSGGYLDRARRVADFLNNRQYAPASPGDPTAVYGTYARGQ